MLRALIVATLSLVSAHAASGQEPSVLHITIVIADAERKPTPVPGHALLVSDNPATASPRRIVTAADGTADVRLRPGNYTVESDRPFVFDGKAYQWTQMLDIVAGRDAVLRLTTDNAEIEAATAATASASAAVAPLEADPSSLLRQWQDSVVALWTPSARASGFLIDASGLIATNQRVIGTATSVEVQLSPDVKVAAIVVAADPVRDVAVLRIDPGVAANVRPVPLACEQAAKPAVAGGQTLFTAGGGVVGITSLVDDENESRRVASRVVRIDEVCEVVASAEQSGKGAVLPSGAHLPVDPVRPFPANARKDAAERRPGSLSAYQMSSSDFDVTFITPPLLYGAQYQAEQGRSLERRGGSRTPVTEPAVLRPLVDFGTWSEYVADVPPVLLVRVTPKLVEGFWTTVARGAARTQGVALPPIKHFKSGFSRLRVLCGEAEVTPIHPFKIAQRVSESDAIYEGLYAFDPGALGPHCGTVKLVLYAEKEPARGDTRTVDPKVLQQIWQDFAPYRQP